jgi:hypothetical protein
MVQIIEMIMWILESGDSMDLRNVDSTAYIYMVPSSKNRIHVSIEPS